MKLPEFAVKRPVTVTMLAIALLLFGFISLSRIGLGFLPKLEFPITAVVISYPGADPASVEEQITKIVEPSLRRVSGLNRVMATSAENVAFFILEFKWGTDLKEASDEIRSLLDVIAYSLPSEVGKPIIYRLDPNQLPLAAYSLAADDVVKAGQFAEEVLKPALESLDEVAGVEIDGKATREVEVAYYTDKLREYNLSPQVLSQMLQYQNILVPVGKIEDEGKIYNAKAGHTFASLTELKELVVGQGPTQTVSPFLGLALPKMIKLGEVAEIEDHYRQSGQYTTVNGSPAIVVSVFKAADANTVKAAREVEKKLQSLNNPDFSIKPLFTQSEYIESALNSLALDGLFGGLLALLVLYFFLRNLRPTLVIGIAIPFSVVVTFSLMYAMGINFNLISLGGLALGLGMLVDNSIVVLENIYSKRQEGLGATEAAIQGTTEVGVAITASTLTTLVVFLPVVFMNSLAGHIFRELALTVTFSLTSSLIVALTLVPLLSAKVLQLKECELLENKDQSRGFTGLQHRYGQRLEKMLEHPGKWLLITGVLVVLSLLFIPFMNLEMIPEENSNQISVQLVLPAGTPTNETVAVLNSVEPAIKNLPQVDQVLSRAGQSEDLSLSSLSTSSASNKANLLVILEKPKGTWTSPVDAYQVAERIRSILAATTKEYPSLESKVSVESMLAQAGLESSLRIRVKGQEEQVVEETANKILEDLKSWPEFSAVTWSYAGKEPLMTLAINPSRVLMGGQISGQVALAVRQAIVGEKAGQITIDGKRVPIVLKAHDKTVKTLVGVEDLYFPSTTSLGSGPNLGLRLGNVVEVQKDLAPTYLEREGGERVIEVIGTPVLGAYGKVSKKVGPYLNKLSLPQGITAELGGTEKMRKDAYRDLVYAGILALVLVYMVMASQFEGLISPLIIMVTIPLAIIGSLALLFIYNRTISIPAIIGMIILAGIVVNNGIVLVDYINQLRKNGLALKEATIKGAKDRLRAILMTALTTILGLLPMALSLGNNTKLQVPMAITVMGGLLTSTLLTLFVVPCVYIIVGKVDKHGKEN